MTQLVDMEKGRLVEALTLTPAERATKARRLIRKVMDRAALTPKDYRALNKVRKLLLGLATDGERHG